MGRSPQEELEPSAKECGQLEMTLQGQRQRKDIPASPFPPVLFPGLHSPDPNESLGYGAHRTGREQGPGVDQEGSRGAPWHSGCSSICSGPCLIQSFIKLQLYKHLIILFFNYHCGLRNIPQRGISPLTCVCVRSLVPNLWWK
jgi:hypothetical protein